jgi:hypothetical protein
MPRIDDPPTCLYVAMERKGELSVLYFSCKNRGSRSRLGDLPREERAMTGKLSIVQVISACARDDPT